MDLTVQDIHDFVNAINRGREAIGEDAVSIIRFDEAQPNNSYSCLSARHLFVRKTGDYVDVDYAHTANADRLRQVFARASGMGNVVIPDEILKVTRVFDEGIDDEELLRRLRGLFVEAGYIDEP